MFKKEYFIVFALIGLSIAYVLLSLIVFITRGRWCKAFNKKLFIGATIVAFCALLNSGSPAYAQTATPEPVVIYGVPDVNVMFTPDYQNVKINSDFATEIHVNTVGFRLASYDFTINYGAGVISVDTTKGTNGVDPGVDGFSATSDISEPGNLTISGSHETSSAYGNDVHLCTIYWTAGSDTGSTILDLTINRLAGESGGQIGIPTDIDGRVSITAIRLGDVNTDELVDIVDALLVSQYYVDLNPPNFDTDAADVDANGQIDIVDALLIARKYVGLIDKFPAEE
ncbi:MAG: dockerin type I repeat-containing protein [Spirochaetales bacterium]|nr:dockerin type I repeat-containing protein [Spirochaetales bacterium]